MQSLNKNIFNTLLTQLPSLIISIVAGIFITRLLGPEGKGVFSVYLANIEIMTLMFSFGTQQGIIYFISNEKINEQKIQAVSLIVFFIAIFFNSIIIFNVSNRIIFVDNYNDLFYKLFLFFVFAISFINSIIIAFLKAKKQFKKVNLVMLISSALNLITYFAVYILNKFSLINSSIRLIFIVSIALIIINLIFYLVFFLKTYSFKPNFNLKLKTDIFPFYKFSFVGFLGMLVNFLNYRLDIWFVSYFKGTIQLGLYALAVNFSQLIMMISKIISSVMMPYLSEDDIKQRRNIFQLYSRVNFFVISIGVAILYFVGNFLLVFLYGQDFYGSIAPFKILIISMIFTGTSQLFSSYISASGRNDLCLYTNITGLVFTVVLDIVLIPKYGIIGSAYATFFSYLSIFLVYFAILIIKDKFSIKQLFIIRISDFKTILNRE